MRRVRLREGALEAMKRRHGARHDNELAAAMGVDHTIVVRLRAGQQPGHVALAGIVAAWPTARLKEIFELFDADDTDDQLVSNGESAAVAA